MSDCRRGWGDCGREGMSAPKHGAGTESMGVLCTARQRGQRDRVARGQLMLMQGQGERWEQGLGNRRAGANAVARLLSTALQAATQGCMNHVHAAVLARNHPRGPQQSLVESYPPTESCPHKQCCCPVSPRPTPAQ